MKKLIMAISIALFVSLAASASNKHGIYISYAVKNKFSEEFPSIKNVTWSADDSYLVATFTDDNAVTKAYFTADADPVATVKEISFADLPASVQKEIHEKYGDYTISQVVDFTDNDPYNESTFFDLPDQQLNYFVSMVKDGKELILQVDNNNKIGFFEKRKE